MLNLISTINSEYYLMKSKLLSLDSVLCPRDPKERIFATDASTKGISAVLSHVNC